jgi:lipopolysaccharide export system protein LptA
MTKGTIVLRGARLEVRQDAEGYQFGILTADPGQARLLPAKHRARAWTSSSKARPSSHRIRRQGRQRALLRKRRTAPLPGRNHCRRGLRQP